MIKYADRGLVEKGGVSILFEYLYYIACFFLVAVFLGFGVVKSIRNERPWLTIFCENGNWASASYDIWKAMVLHVAFTGILGMALSKLCFNRLKGPIFHYP